MLSLFTHPDFLPPPPLILRTWKEMICMMLKLLIFKEWGNGEKPCRRTQLVHCLQKQYVSLIWRTAQNVSVFLFFLAGEFLSTLQYNPTWCINDARVDVHFHAFMQGIFVSWPSRNRPNNLIVYKDMKVSGRLLNFHFWVSCHF